jgi:hypothetical protein
MLRVIRPPGPNRRNAGAALACCVGCFLRHADAEKHPDVPRGRRVRAVLSGGFAGCYITGMTGRWNLPALRLAVFALLALSLLALGGCATAPPRHTDAHDAQQRWGTPINVLMAFVRRESSFHEHARPERHWFLFIPLPRKSSAYGYAQAQDPVWRRYRKATGGLFKSRSDMDDALDFIGWYTDLIHRQLGISKWDPEHLYIAYHEGIGGYRSGRWRRDRQLLDTARGVAFRAREYGAQLKHCEESLRCRHWYQFFCH